MSEHQCSVGFAVVYATHEEAVARAEEVGQGSQVLVFEGLKQEPQP